MTTKEKYEAAKEAHDAARKAAFIAALGENPLPKAECDRLAAVEKKLEKARRAAFQAYMEDDSD